jgi:tyrosine-protein phosphatase SIW14
MKRSLGAGWLIFLFAAGLRVAAQTQTAAPVTPSAAHVYGEKVQIQGVPNAGKVNEHLYRGAQPQEAGLLELKKLGMTTIVNLRAAGPQVSWEQGKAEALGIRFVNIPVGGFSPPADGQVAQFLSIFREHPEEKVFVHCRYGDDRTGVFVATYRMAFDGFLSDEALNEMYKFGFNGPWHASMETFVRQFPKRLETSPSLATFKKPNGK